MSENRNTGFYYCIDCKHIGRLTDMYFDKCEKCISDNCIIFHNKINIPLYEIDMLKQVSRDKKFLQSMVDLQENDIIEYQLKIKLNNKSVFKNPNPTNHVVPNAALRQSPQGQGE